MILFSIGPAAAVVSTMIYAIPPAIRITALGIRGVPVNTVEAATSMGVTRTQLLARCSSPRPTHDPAGRQPDDPLRALDGRDRRPDRRRRPRGGRHERPLLEPGARNPGRARDRGHGDGPRPLLRGDRAADRSGAQHLDEARKRFQTLALVAAIVAGVGLAKALGVGAAYPDEVGSPPRMATIEEWLLAKIQVVLDYVQDPTTWVFAITERVGVFILQQLLLPLQEFLVEAPWFTTVVGLTAIAFVVSGLRPALTTLAMLGVIGFTGVWALAMDTLSQVLVATAIAAVLGVVLGVLAAESNRFSKAMRPVNDLLQTLPQLVYIIPFIYLMPVSIVPGIVAGVLYAFPVTLRLVERGVRDVAPTSVEAASAFGASRRQVLTKVKLPLAGDAVMLGINQAIIMVLAVVVIAGLVGSGGLGYEVAQGLVRGQFGQGVIASVAILALGIALDRVTQGTRQSRKEGIA